MADRWYDDVDEDYVQRCRVIAAEVWAEKFEHAQDRGWGSDEEDQDDPYAGVEVSYHLPGEGYVSVMIGDDTVIDYVRVERLEAALLALRPGKAEPQYEREQPFALVEAELRELRIREVHLYPERGAAVTQSRPEGGSLTTESSESMLGALEVLRRSRHG